jgi:hypothetical protein
MKSDNNSDEIKPAQSLYRVRETPLIAQLIKGRRG